jgi:hypothetical protein
VTHASESSAAGTTGDRMQAFLGACGGATGTSGNETIFRCPCSDRHSNGDRNPSASARMTDDGKLLVTCRTGCRTEDMVAAIGWSMADLMPPQGATTSPPPRPTAKPPRKHRTAENAAKVLAWRNQLIEFYVYQNASALDVGLVARIQRANGKSMPQARYDGTTWLTGEGQSLPRPCPVYRLPELLVAPADKPVLIPEGEKKVALLQKLGSVATCTAMGAGKAKHSDLTPLRGRDVVLLADNDDAGRAHVQDLAERLQTVGARSIRIAELPNLPIKGDVCDWYADRTASGADDQQIADELRVIVEDAADYRDIDDGSQEDSEAPTDGAPRFKSRLRSRDEFLQQPFPLVLIDSVLTKGSVVVLAAHPNIGKSTMAIAWAHCLQAGRDWHGHKVRPGSSLMLLGEDTVGQSMRARAWETEYAPTVEEIGDRYIEWADRIPPLVAEGARELRGLIETCIAKHGHAPAMLVMDTLSTIAGFESENDNAEGATFIAMCNRLAEEFGCTIVLIHHLNKVEGEITLRSIRGASSVPANADDVLAMADDGGGLIKIFGLKGRNSSKTSQQFFRMHAVPIGHNADGDAVSSVIMLAAQVDLVDAKEQKRAHEEATWTDAEARVEKAVATLRKMESARSRNDIAARMTGKRTLKLAAINDAIERGLIVEVGTTKRPKLVLKEDVSLPENNREGGCARNDIKKGEPGNQVPTPGGSGTGSVPAQEGTTGEPVGTGEPVATDSEPPRRKRKSKKPATKPTIDDDLPEQPKCRRKKSTKTKAATPSGGAA